MPESALTKCLEIEGNAILDSAHRMNYQEVEKALAFLIECSNQNAKLITCGVGKSGIVARKIASTFSSIGLTSIYLNPLDALHGDLGVVADKDICLLISNSGETQELIEIFPHLKKKGVKFISITGNKNSKLSLNSDATLDAAVSKEACPLNLAPTASTSVSMAIGDALAAVWMNRKGISNIDFATNHPSGILGKRLTLTVKDVMIPIENLTGIDAKLKFQELIKYITLDNIGCCYVHHKKDKKKLIGLITDGDLRRALVESKPSKWEFLSAEDIMTNDPIKLEIETLAIDALKKMENNEKGKSVLSMPVINRTKDLEEIVGIIRLHDLIQIGLK